MSIKKFYEVIKRHCAKSGIELTREVVDAVLAKLINEEGTRKWQYIEMFI